MAEGAVDTPQGPLTPPLRRYSESHGPKQLRSAGPVLSLPAGLNRFGFTGQWRIDRNLYTFSTRPLEATLGSWSHDWHPSREQSEFQKANGRPFEEQQYIFRLRGTHEFAFLLAPYRKGQRPDMDVKLNGSEIVVTRNGSVTKFDEQCYSYADARSTVLTSFGPSLCKTSQMSVQGGAAEVLLENNRATITAHGTAGLRAISIPGAWSTAAPVEKRNGQWLVNYANGQPTTITLTPAPE